MFEKKIQYGGNITWEFSPEGVTLKRGDEDLLYLSAAEAKDIALNIAQYYKSEMQGGEMNAAALLSKPSGEETTTNAQRENEIPPEGLDPFNEIYGVE